MRALAPPLQVKVQIHNSKTSESIALDVFEFLKGAFLNCLNVNLIRNDCLLYQRLPINKAGDGDRRLAAERP